MTDSNHARAIESPAVEAAVGELVAAIFASLQTIADATRDLWGRLESTSTAPRTVDLAGLREVIVGELQRRGTMFNGTGVVVADQLLADSPRYLEWWRTDHKHGGTAQKLSLDLNPNSEYFYDYTSMEWFAVPRDRGIPWVYGPYLDYTGVDLYVCTFGVPITSTGGLFLGVAAADVPVAALDAKLLPTFTAASQPVALINAEGRVIVANHVDHVTGSKIRTSDRLQTQQIPDTPWSLVRLNP